VRSSSVRKGGKENRKGIQRVLRKDHVTVYLRWVTPIIPGCRTDKETERIQMMVVVLKRQPPIYPPKKTSSLTL